MAWIYVGPGGKRWTEEIKGEAEGRKDSESLQGKEDRTAETAGKIHLTEAEGSHYTLSKG